MGATPGLIDALEAWGFIDGNRQVDSLSLRDVRNLAEDLQDTYSLVSPELGGCHIGLHDSINIAEGRAPLAGLAFPLLVNEVVWLPDPILSFISREDARLWHLSFDAGGDYFGRPTGPRMPWRCLWDHPTPERRNEVRRRLPKLLELVRALEPLLRSGAVRLFPWERLAYSDASEMKAALVSLRTNDLTGRAQTKYRQGEYTLGPRVGRIDISATDDFPNQPVKKGDAFHFADTGPVLLNTLANLAVSARTGSRYNPSKRGDRLMLDFVASGGTAVPTIKNLSPEVRVPDLNAALWPEIVEIRKQSEAAEELRRVLDSIDDYEGPEEDIKELVADKMFKAAERLRQDTSLARAARDSMTNITIDGVMTGGTLGGTALVADAGGAAAIAIGIAAVPVKNFLTTIFDGVRRVKRRRSDLLIRVGSRLTE